MNKQTAVIIKKVALKEKYNYRQLKKYYQGLSWQDKTKLLQEGRKL